MTFRFRKRSFAAVVGLAACSAQAAFAGTGVVSVSPQQVGQSLQYVGYNMGHYLPGSNTSAWVDYSGVNAYRVWAGSSYYEPTNSSVVNPSTGSPYRDDFGPWGDGVSDLSSFNARKSALRGDPLSQKPGSPQYVDWAKFNDRFANYTQTGTNQIKLDYVLGELKDRGIHVMQQTQRSASAYPITGESDWAGKWEQWQHYYAMAFHSARNYDVSQFQMYNEPDGDTAETQADYLIRLKLASDAVRSAVSDVNRLYRQDKTPLVADIAAPTTAGGSSKVDGNGDPTRAWGKVALQNIRTDYQGQTVNYDIFNTYAAQVYGKDGPAFGDDVAGIRSKIPLYHAGGAAAGQAMPVILSEFNRFTSNNYAVQPESLETPSVVTDLATIYLQAMSSGADSMYAFKFSQTLWTPTGSTAEEPQKTGFHYVSDAGTKDITGATHASGVVRLVAKAFKDQRSLLSTGAVTGLSGYDSAASYDPASKNYHLFGVNRSSVQNHTLTFDLSEWNVSPDTMVSVEEVSPGHNGEVTQLVGIPSNKQLTLTQPTQSVWLMTIPSGPAVAPTKFKATDDAGVQNADASSPSDHSAANFGAAPGARVGRSGGSARFDYATYLKFNVGSTDAGDVSRAILRVQGAARNEDGSTSAPILFHLYALANDAWNENAITWDNAPNLADLDAKAEGVGASAFPVGQLTFSGGASQLLGIDLTSFLSDHPELFDDGQLSFALVREERFAGDADGSLSFVELDTRETAGGFAPELMLFVPEPGSIAMLAVAATGLLRRRR